MTDHEGHGAAREGRNQRKETTDYPARHSRSQRGMATKNTKRHKPWDKGIGRMILGRMITGNEVPQAFVPEVLAARPEPAANPASLRSSV